MSAARRIEDVRVAALVMVGPESRVGALLQRRTSPQQLLVLHDLEDLERAQREVSVASLFAIGETGGGIDVGQVLDDVYAFWPAAPRVCFSRSTLPAPPKGTPHTRLEIELHRPSRDPRGTVTALEERTTVAAAARRTEIASARAFAERHGLPELAASLCAAIACGIPAERLAAFIGKTPGTKFNKYCSETVYPRVGVSSLPDLVSRVLRSRLTSTALDSPRVTGAGVGVVGAAAGACRSSSVTPSGSSPRARSRRR